MNNNSYARRGAGFGGFSQRQGAFSVRQPPMMGGRGGYLRGGMMGNGIATRGGFGGVRRDFEGGFRGDQTIYTAERGVPSMTQQRPFRERESETFREERPRNLREE
jgi:hypothetical protein